MRKTLVQVTKVYQLLSGMWHWTCRECGNESIDWETSDDAMTALKRHYKWAHIEPFPENCPVEPY